MAREVTDPVPDEEIEALSEAIRAQRDEVREFLASELGGDPDDYRADRYLADHTGEPRPDGGD